MQPEIVRPLVEITVNVVGVLLICVWMVCALVRVRWHGRGLVSVALAIFAMQLLCVVPTLIRNGLSLPTASSVSSCLPNALVSLFALILLSEAARRIPQQLEDSARLDGLGGLRPFWRVIFPFAGREFGLIALLTVILMILAQTSPVMEWLFLSTASSFPKTQLGTVGVWLLEFLIMTILVFALFLVVKPNLKDG